MWWLTLTEAVIGVWFLLLAYRVVGKRPGQDPKYDDWIEFYAGSFKVMGMLGIIASVLQVVGLLVGLLL
jgi:hypothetical protein